MGSLRGREARPMMWARPGSADVSMRAMALRPGSERCVPILYRQRRHVDGPQQGVSGDRSGLHRRHCGGLVAAQPLAGRHGCFREDQGGGAQQRQRKRADGLDSENGALDLGHFNFSLDVPRG